MESFLYCHPLQEEVRLWTPLLLLIHHLLWVSCLHHLLGSFLDATIARTKQLENTTATPASSPESREHPSNDFDDAYIELDAGPV
jgi:hypothetical protein